MEFVWSTLPHQPVIPGITPLASLQRHQNYPSSGVCRRAALSNGLSYRGCTAQFFTFDLDLPARMTDYSLALDEDSGFSVVENSCL